MEVESQSGVAVYTLKLLSQNLISQSINILFLNENTGSPLGGLGSNAALYISLVLSSHIRHQNFIRTIVRFCPCRYGRWRREFAVSGSEWNAEATIGWYCIVPDAPTEMGHHS